MDFLKMSEEYKQSAERLLCAIKKQKAKLEHARNREEINALINVYKKYILKLSVCQICSKRELSRKAIKNDTI